MPCWPPWAAVAALTQTARLCRPAARRQTAPPSAHHLPHRNTQSCCWGLRPPCASCAVQSTHKQRKSFCSPCKDTADFVLNLYCNRWLCWPRTHMGSCPLLAMIEGTLHFLCVHLFWMTGWCLPHDWQTERRFDYLSDGKSSSDPLLQSPERWRGRICS